MQRADRAVRRQVFDQMVCRSLRGDEIIECLIMIMGYDNNAYGLR